MQEPLKFRLICKYAIIDKRSKEVAMGTFYVDPVVEATKYGINVFADAKHEHLQDGESGMIERNSDGTVTIWVADEDSLERQRFTVAHELGHYVNGHLDENTKMLRDSNKSYSQDNYDLKEYEANKYAAELLMPKDKIDFLLNNKGITTVNGLAKALIVSPAAMTIRLKNLGWIN